MNRSRILSLVLIIIVWFSTTGFLPVSENQPSNALAVSPSNGNPAPLAAVTMGKITPAKGVSGLPASSVRLEWGPIQGYTGAVTYRYCVGTSKNCPKSKWIRVGTALNATVTNLKANTTYYWSVRAYNAQNVMVIEADGGPWTFTTLPVPGTFTKTGPVAPNNTLLNPASVVLQWNTNSTNATSYEYCIDTTNDQRCDPSVGWKAAASGVTPTGLSLNAVYYWQVRAVNGSGTTLADWGAWWTFTTALNPGVFDKLSPANTAANQPVSNFALSWMVSPNATSYRYCLSTTAATCSGVWQDVGNVTSFTLPTTLLYDTDYYWQVQAVAPTGTTDANAGIWWMFRTQPPLPATFSKWTPTANAQNLYTDVTFTWQPSSGATGYEFCYYLINNEIDCIDGPWDTLAGTSTKVYGLEVGKTYYWQVRAINSTGTMDANSATWWMFTTQPNPPTDFTKTDPIDGATRQATTLTLTWTPSSTPGATYQVCYDTSNDGECELDNWRAATTSSTYSLSGLTSGITYYWQARATNAGGTTYADYDMATWWSFTTLYPAPAAFGKTSPSNGLTDQPLNLSLVWGPSSAGVTYEVCYDKTSSSTCDGDAWQTVPAQNGATYNLTGLDRAATYYWQVRAKNSEDTITEADEGTWWSFTTIPNPPDRFTKASPVVDAGPLDTALTLTWNASLTEGTSYEICYVLSGDACETTDWRQVTPEMGATYKPTGLIEGTTYYWQVRGSNAGGTTYADGLVDAGWTFTTRLPAPAAFEKTAPDASGPQPLDLALTWTASDPGAAYEVCYTISGGTCAEADWQAVSEAQGLSFALTDQELAYATTYTWQVRAKNAEGRTTQADAGAWWTFTTMLPPPGGFSKSSPQDTTGGQVPDLTLSWTVADQDAVYEYCVSATSGQCPSEQDWKAAAGGSAAPAGLTYDKTYFWQVRAKNSEGTTTQANTGTWWRFTTHSAPPTDFVKTSPANNAANRPLNLTLSWSSAGTGFTYAYCIGETTPLSCATWQEVNATSVQPANLQHAKTYYWQVRAIDSSGHTTDANQADTDPIWKFSTLPVPPSSKDAVFNNVAEDQVVSADLSGANQMTFELYGAQPVGALTLLPTGHFTYDPPQDYVGPITFQFKVTDHLNDPVGPYTVSIAYIPVNDLPVIAPIADITAISGESVAFTPSVTDPDLTPEQPLVYAISGQPAGASFDTATGAFQWQAAWAPGSSNAYTVTLTVSDGFPTENPVQETFTITVLPKRVFLPIVIR